MGTQSLPHPNSINILCGGHTPWSPESRVYIRVHTWWCTFYGFWQMCVTMNTSYWIISLPLKSPVLSVFITPHSSTPPWAPHIPTDLFILSMVCLFPNVIHSWYSMVCHLSKLTSSSAAKSLQLCPTLCDPIDGSPPGSPILGIPQRPHGLQPTRLLRPWGFPGKSTRIYNYRPNFFIY